MKLVGIVGLIGSGKSTAGDVLSHELGFKRLAFASILKDATATLFGWPRELLEGDTAASREFREIEDVYWTKVLKRRITPRIVLQEMGTEVIRESFHEDFWILALERQILTGQHGQGPYVVTDCRFPNEMDFIKKNHGTLIKVRRGPEPDWFPVAQKINRIEAGEDVDVSVYSEEYDDLRFNHKPKVHESEWKWIREEEYYDYVVDNDSTLEEFKQKLRNIGKEINL